MLVICFHGISGRRSVVLSASRLTASPMINGPRQAPCAGSNRPAEAQVELPPSQKKAKGPVLTTGGRKGLFIVCGRLD